MESIISAILAGAVTPIGVLIANSRSQAVTDTKLDVFYAIGRITEAEYKELIELLAEKEKESEKTSE